MVAPLILDLMGFPNGQVGMLPMKHGPCPAGAPRSGEGGHRDESDGWHLLRAAGAMAEVFGWDVWWIYLLETDGN